MRCEVPIEGGIKKCNLCILILSWNGRLYIINISQIECIALKGIPREVIFGDGCKLIISEFDKSLLTGLLDD